MTAFWGDDSWAEIAYKTTGQLTLLGREETIKAPNPEIAVAFKERLIRVAGFEYVPDPIPMKNSKNADVYYLFFASHNRTGSTIIKHIFDKHSSVGR